MENQNKCLIRHSSQKVEDVFVEALNFVQEDLVNLKKEKLPLIFKTVINTSIKATLMYKLKTRSPITQESAKICFNRSYNRVKDIYTQLIQVNVDMPLLERSIKYNYINSSYSPIDYFEDILSSRGFIDVYLEEKYGISPSMLDRLFSEKINYYTCINKSNRLLNILGIIDKTINRFNKDVQLSLVYSFLEYMISYMGEGIKLNQLLVLTTSKFLSEDSKSILIELITTPSYNVLREEKRSESAELLNLAKGLSKTLKRCLKDSEKLAQEYNSSSIFN